MALPVEIKEEKMKLIIGQMKCTKKMSGFVRSFIKHKTNAWLTESSTVWDGGV